MKALIGMFALFFLWGVSAQAQNAAPAPDDLTSALQQIGNEQTAAIANACRGPIDNELSISTGIPNDPQDDARCQSVATLESSCLNLAGQAGGLQDGVLTGTATYESETNTLMNESGPGVAVGLSALYLAEHASPGTSAGQLALETYAHCTALISGP